MRPGLAHRLVYPSLTSLSGMSPQRPLLLPLQSYIAVPMLCHSRPHIKVVPVVTA